MKQLKQGSVEVGKFIGYIIFMPAFMLVGIIYKPLKWMAYKCSNFDQSYYE